MDKPASKPDLPHSFRKHPHEIPLLPLPNGPAEWRTYRIAIQHQTFHILYSSKPAYRTVDSKTVHLPLHEMLASTLQTRTITDGLSMSLPRHDLEMAATSFRPEPRVMVLQADCLTAARDLLKSGLNPFVLNMANAVKPGGSWQEGSGAQEENFFRRTNYMMHLCRIEGSQWGRGSVEYPIPTFGGIYSKDVVVFRGEKEGTSSLYCGSCCHWHSSTLTQSSVQSKVIHIFQNLTQSPFSHARPFADRHFRPQFLLPQNQLLLLIF